MIKHEFKVYGIYGPINSPFEGSCIASDIKEAIDIFRSKLYSVHKIEQGNQVGKDEVSRILGIILTERKY